jgi:hypothetical protein
MLPGCPRKHLDFIKQAMHTTYYVQSDTCSSIKLQTQDHFYDHCNKKFKLRNKFKQVGHATMELQLHTKQTDTHAHTHTHTHTRIHTITYINKNA